MRHLLGMPSRAAAWVVGLLTLTLHGAIAAVYDAVPFRKYPLAAELLIDGKLAPERWIDFSPLYLLISTLAQAAPKPELQMALLNWGVSAATVAIFFLWLDARLGRGWALLGSAVLAFDRHLLIYQRVLEPEALFLFLVMLFLWLLDGENGRPKSPLAAGIVGSLGIAVRPTFLPLCLLALAIWGFSRRRDFKAWTASAIPFTVPIVLILLLQGAYVHFATGSARTPVMNPGTVLFEGNQPMSGGTSAVYPPLVWMIQRSTEGQPDPAHMHYREVARAAEGALTVRQVNGFWSDRAKAFWVDQPLTALRRAGTKLLYIFHGFRWHDLPAGWVYDRYFPVPGVPFALLSALALPGLLIELRRRDDSLMLYGVLASQMMVMLVFYVSPRQRLVLVPLLIYFALVAIDGLRRGLTKIVWLLALTLFLSFSLPDPAMRDEMYQRIQLEKARGKLSQVRAAVQRGEPMAAHAERFAQALGHAPWWLDGLQPAFLPRQGRSLERQIASHMDDSVSLFDRAEMWMRTGDTEKARSLLEAEIESGRTFYRQGRQTSLPELLLARVDLAEGNLDAARHRLRQALKQHPGEAYVLADLFALDGDPEHFELLTRYYSEPDARFLAGRALLRLDRADAALEHLERLVEALPGFREGRLLLAAAYQREGRLEDGLAQALAADEIRPEPVWYAEAIAELYRASAQEADPETTLRAAQGLYHYGRPAEALTLIDRPWNSSLEPVVRRLRAQLKSTLSFVSQAAPGPATQLSPESTPEGTR